MACIDLSVLDDSPDREIGDLLLAESQRAQHLAVVSAEERRWRTEFAGRRQKPDREGVQRGDR